MQIFLAIIGGLGIGTLIAQVVTHFMARRASANDRLYQEKREAYLALLNAFHHAELQGGPLSWQEYVLCQTQCSLFGSVDVLEAAQRLAELKDGPTKAREAAFHKLLREMRVDLGQSAPPLGPT